MLAAGTPQLLQSGYQEESWFTQMVLLKTLASWMLTKSPREMHLAGTSMCDMGNMHSHCSIASRSTRRYPTSQRGVKLSEMLTLEILHLLGGSIFQLAVYISQQPSVLRCSQCSHIPGLFICLSTFKF